MPVTFNAQESYRDDFTFRNSPAAIARFPFPFPADDYRDALNLEPALAGAPGSVFEHRFDIDEHYLSETAERAQVLARDPLRSVVMPHMHEACWDALEMLMTQLAADYPEHFRLTRAGARWTWENAALGIRQRFVFGDADTLPYEPLEYIGRQVQGDFALLDQRDGELFLDAGLVTGPAAWSLAIDIGMSFRHWLAPLPLAPQTGELDRALQLLLDIQAGRPVRRLNWTMTVNPRLDTSAETYRQWVHERGQVTAENVARLVHLRVELQHMARLPRSNALLFGIRTYLIALDELASNLAWACRLHRVLRDLPEALAEHKGLSRYRPIAVDWLRRFDPQGTAV